MIVNTMYVFYGKDNLPYKDKEREVHFPIVGGAFQGASNTTKIRFYIEQIGDIDATWIAVSKLPNGKIGSQLLEPNYDSEVGENYVEMSLTSFYTQAKGDLYVSLQGFERGEITYDSEEQIFTTTGNPVIQATGSVKIAINYATQGVGSGEDEEITPEDIYGAIGEKLDKGSTHYVKVVESLTAINTTANENYLNENDIVYDKTTDCVYKLSGEYPSFVATKIEHMVIIPPNADFSDGYQLTDEEYEKLLHSDSVIWYNTSVYQWESQAPIAQAPTKIFVCRIGPSGAVNESTLRVKVLTLFFSTKKVQFNETTQIFYTKGKIDDLISTITGNEFTLVDTTTYPTLNSFLASSGEEGIIYLYPVNDGNDNYYKYIWEDNRWISLGTTELDVSQFVHKTSSNNKVYATDNSGDQTTISYGTTTDSGSIAQRDSNGDLLVPDTASSNSGATSKKYVDDNIQEVREVAEGKCNSYVLSYSWDIAYVKNLITSDPIHRYHAYNYDGTEITQDIVNGDYDEVRTADSSFNTQNDTVSFPPPDDLIVRGEDSFKFIYIPYSQTDKLFKIGDIIYVLETDVPDRWISSTYVASKMETTKINIENYYAKDEDLEPTSSSLYSLGTINKKFKDLYLGGIVYLKQIGQLTYDGTIGAFTFNDDIYPNVGATYNLGNGSYAWKNIYLNGEIVQQTGGSQYKIVPNSSSLDIYLLGNKSLVFTTTSFYPETTGTVNLGSSSYKWNNIYGNTLKGFSTMTQAQYDALVSGGTVDSDTFYFIEE